MKYHQSNNIDYLFPANGGSGTLQWFRHDCGVPPTDCDHQNRFFMFAGLQIEKIPFSKRPPMLRLRRRKRRRNRTAHQSSFNVNMKRIVELLQAKTANVIFKVKKLNASKSEE